MKTDDFDYELEDWRIAQHPEEKRDHSKLLIMDRMTGEITHDLFYHLDQYLNQGDVLVMNDTRVLPARLFGHRPEKEESIEVLLLVEKEKDLWECLVRPGKKMKNNQKIIFGEGQLRGQVEGITEDGSRMIRFQYDGIFQERLEELGTMPLPPYITEKLEDQERYQTVYSKINGSAAAPTAGLHFTEGLLDKLAHKGIQQAFITLHVGLGTFRPVQVDDVKKHKMHSEWYHIGEESCRKIVEAKKKNKKIIAVGTTTMRTLETVSRNHGGKLVPETGWTDIFIYPGFEFNIVDELITNFHLPKSTLLMLISAFSSREKVLHAYEVAKKKDYRFFSFGDAMLLRKD
ncbi:MAG: tRNA preQ1(34) S-adenosylmethionine ribosyltransferase-isomerase QueA [Tissierellia bacterium]|nr:tRNA preQ1(34) S-adenosylmethionine ribosyltransferase-isomerase QueA [Tissierellia bacterium]